MDSKKEAKDYFKSQGRLLIWWFGWSLLVWGVATLTVWQYLDGWKTWRLVIGGSAIVGWFAARLVLISGPQDISGGEDEKP